MKVIENQNPDGTKRRTGPKTERGRRHSSRNALRHGLSTPIECDPHYSTLIDPLSRAILGDDVNPAHLPRARKVAQALLEVDRLRRFAKPVPHQLLGDRVLPQVTSEASRRYLSRAYGRLRSSIKRLDDAQWRACAFSHRKHNDIAPIEIDLNQ